MTESGIEMLAPTELLTLIASKLAEASEACLTAPLHG